MDEILTVNDVALLLKVADKTVYSMAQAGDLPSFRVRGQWRFRMSDIDVWISEQVRKSSLGLAVDTGTKIDITEKSILEFDKI